MSGTWLEQVIVETGLVPLRQCGSRWTEKMRLRNLEIPSQLLTHESYDLIFACESVQKVVKNKSVT